MESWKNSSFKEKYIPVNSDGIAVTFKGNINQNFATNETGSSQPEHNNRFHTKESENNGSQSALKTLDFSKVIEVRNNLASQATNYHTIDGQNT